MRHDSTTVHGERSVGMLGGASVTIAGCGGGAGSLTAEEVAAIRSGRLVAKDSSGSSHVHTVTFNG
jgi:hypothetical protein